MMMMMASSWSDHVLCLHSNSRLLWLHSRRFSRSHPRIFAVIPHIIITIASGVREKIDLPWHACHAIILNHIHGGQDCFRVSWCTGGHAIKTAVSWLHYVIYYCIAMGMSFVLIFCLLGRHFILFAVILNPQVAIDWVSEPSCMVDWFFGWFGSFEVSD